MSTPDIHTFIHIRTNVYYACFPCLHQDKCLLARVQLFLTRQQLQLVENVESVPRCSIDHVFAYGFESIALDCITEIKPYVPSKIFSKGTGQWQESTVVGCILYMLRVMYHNIVRNYYNIHACMYVVFTIIVYVGRTDEVLDCSSCKGGC